MNNPSLIYNFASFSFPAPIEFPTRVEMEQLNPNAAVLISNAILHRTAIIANLIAPIYAINTIINSNDHHSAIKEIVVDNPTLP